MSTTTTRTRTFSITSRSLAISVILLSALTGLVHLYLGIETTRMLTNDPEQVAALGGAAGFTVMAALFYTASSGTSPSR